MATLSPIEAWRVCNFIGWKPDSHSSLEDRGANELICLGAHPIGLV